MRLMLEALIVNIAFLSLFLIPSLLLFVLLFWQANEIFIYFEQFEFSVWVKFQCHDL